MDQPPPTSARSAAWSSSRSPTRSRAAGNRHRRPRWQTAAPWIVGNSLAGAVVGVSCYQWALSTTPTGIVLPIVALTPLIVIPFAYLIEGERPGVRSLVGGAVAVAATATLAYFRR